MKGETPDVALSGRCEARGVLESAFDVCVEAPISRAEK